VGWPLTVKRLVKVALAISPAPGANLLFKLGSWAELRYKCKSLAHRGVRLDWPIIQTLIPNIFTVIMKISILVLAVGIATGCGNANNSFPATYKGTLTVETSGEWERLAGAWDLSCQATYTFENATLTLEKDGTLAFTAPLLPPDGIAYPSLYLPTCQDAVDWVKLRIAPYTDRGTHDGAGTLKLERIFRGCHQWLSNSERIYRRIAMEGVFTKGEAKFQGSAACRLEDADRPPLDLWEKDFFIGTAVR
jgi:hypothetical protein